MTTTAPELETAPEIDPVETKVEKAKSEKAAEKTEKTVDVTAPARRRGRPPGSKNKPKEGVVLVTPKRRARRTTPQASTSTSRDVSVLLLENGASNTIAVTILDSSGKSETFNVPARFVLDRR